ncbi:hypothetical protein AB0D12_37755 [Streptomyces sp. NPDC048479]|uniref:hypothetical protein n=1 Tax=Streptomyces sp. NPDC048479 TaxID=3154725 RepID=UPI00343B11B3
MPALRAGAGHPLLLGRYSPSGRLRLVARTTQLPDSLTLDLGHLLTRAGPGHPWQDVRITTQWGSREPLNFTCVAPHLVAEFVGDSSIDHGRWWHSVSVQARRIRTDVAPQDVPPA